MKLFLLFLMTITLSGCVFSITPSDYERAVFVCSTNNGVRNILVDVDSFKVYCNSGVAFTVHRKV